MSVWKKPTATTDALGDTRFKGRCFASAFFIVLPDDAKKEAGAMLRPESWLKEGSKPHRFQTGTIKRLRTGTRYPRAEFPSEVAGDC